MSRALATVRHDGRRPSVTPGCRVSHTTRKPPIGGDRLRLRHQPQLSFSDCLSPLRGFGSGLNSPHWRRQDSGATVSAAGWVAITTKHEKFLEELIGGRGQRIVPVPVPG